MNRIWLIVQKQIIFVLILTKIFESRKKIFILTENFISPKNSIWLGNPLVQSQNQLYVHEIEVKMTGLKVKYNIQIKAWPFLSK